MPNTYFITSIVSTNKATVTNAMMAMYPNVFVTNCRVKVSFEVISQCRPEKLVPRQSQT